MRLEVSPPLGDSELAAIRVALARADVCLDDQPAVYTSNWRRAALREALDGDSGHELELEPELELERYTPSPRSTRGATRA